MTGILDETLEGLGEMFEGYSAETCAVKIPLVPMGVLSHLKKPILGGQKPKWAVSPRRVCVTVVRFYRGS